MLGRIWVSRAETDDLGFGRRVGKEEEEEKEGEEGEWVQYDRQVEDEGREEETLGL